MKKEIISIWDSLSNCIKETSESIKANEANKRRIAALQEQAKAEAMQKSYYQQPYFLELSDYQLSDTLMGCRAIGLAPEQSAAITEHYIRQAKINGDVALLKTIQEEATISLDVNFDFVRQIHYKLYECFIKGYYPQLTYANVTPAKQIFTSHTCGYCFIYTFDVQSQKALEKLKENFSGFKATNLCRNLFRHYGIRKAKISYIDDLTIAIILK